MENAIRNQGEDFIDLAAVLLQHTGADLFAITAISGLSIGVCAEIERPYLRSSGRAGGEGNNDQMSKFHFVPSESARLEA